MRRAAGATALALVSCALTIPFAAPAHADTAVERVWAVSDSDVGPNYGLTYTDVPGGTPTPVAEPGLGDVSELSASADGTRLIYLRDTDTAEQVVVRDLSTRIVRVVRSYSTDGSTFATQPLLSPDGKTAVWTEITFGPTFQFLVRKAAVASGNPTTLVSNRGAVTFLDNSTVLTQSATNGSFVATLLNGTTQPFTGLPAEADEVTVSPQGNKIAWYEDTTPQNSDTSTGEIHIGALDFTGTAWTVSGDSVLSTTLDNQQPAFSRDGLSLYWVQYDGDVGNGNVLNRPVDASAPATTVSTTTDEIDVAVTAPQSADVTPPGAATVTSPFTLNGTTPTIRWGLPADADLSGVYVTRTLVGGPAGSPRYFPAPVSSFVDTGLALGKTYEYKIQTMDRSNRFGPVVTRRLTAIKPGPSFGIPTSAKSTKTSFPVYFAAGALSTTKFYADYVPAGGHTWIGWVNGVTGVQRTFGVPGTTNVASTTASQGQSYGFRVKVQDAYGNVSGYVNGTDKAVVPYDQSKAILSGGTTVANSLAYLGSYRRLTTAGQYAKITLTGNRLQVVGWKCSGCGSFAVYDGSTKIATVSSYASSTVARTVLYSRTFTGTGTHTFTIRPVGTAGHPAVLLDGLAMRR